MHMFLITTYMNALHKAFPIIDLEQAGVQQLLVGQNRSSWDLFLLHMIDSIACHCLPSNDCRLLLLSDALLKAALVHFDKLAIHHNIETLQAVLLLAVRSLFDAQNGNIGQKIAFANRLEMELRGLDEEENGSVLRRLRAVMYCLYSRFSSPLDRSSDFLKVVRPEPFLVYGITSTNSRFRISQTSVMMQTTPRYSADYTTSSLKSAMENRQKNSTRP